jgi:hypothetical protein
MNSELIVGRHELIAGAENPSPDFHIKSKNLVREDSSETVCGN